MSIVSSGVLYIVADVVGVLPATSVLSYTPNTVMHETTHANKKK